MHMSVGLLVSVGSGARSLLQGFRHRQPRDLPFTGSASYAVSARLVSKKQCKKLVLGSANSQCILLFLAAHTCCHKPFHAKESCTLG